MKRELYDSDHEAFRKAVRDFLEAEAVPHCEAWEQAGIIDRSIYAGLGANGFIGTAVPEQFGGGGSTDFRFNAVLAEELMRVGLAGLASNLAVHNDICIDYFVDLCTPEQAARWLPGAAAGTSIVAIAMTEPGIGSDLASMSTTAIRDGDEYVVNGAKTFITNGINADLVITAVKTDPTQRHSGISLVVIERDTPGFERGRNLKKLGQRSSDTAELSFTDCRVPVANLLGTEGHGFRHLVEHLPQERMSLAVGAVALARAAMESTLTYAKERKAFGTPIGSFQNSRFKFAEMATEIDIAETYVDRCVEAMSRGQLSAVEAAKAKWWVSEMLGRVVDTCVQLHGGYGYMAEYPISRAYADARVLRIYGGTTEIMKEIIGRDLDL